MFAYCGNNPVDRIDDGGNFWKKLKAVGKAIADAAITVALVATAVISVTGAIMGTIGSGGAGAVAVPAAVAVASQCLAAATVVATAGVTAMAAGAIGENISLMSKPNSGRIRYNDGTGINPKTGKSVQSQKEAEEIYKSLTDPKQKANWRKWMKGKGWRQNHLK